MTGSTSSPTQPGLPTEAVVPLKLTQAVKHIAAAAHIEPWGIKAAGALLGERMLWYGCLVAARLAEASLRLGGPQDDHRSDVHSRVHGVCLQEPRRPAAARRRGDLPA